MGNDAILCRRLGKRYDHKLALDGLDLVVERGEIFGYLGSNGAGKTTTIRCLLDLIRPTTGSAQVLALDAHRDSLQIRGRIGYLPGDLRLYPRLTARQLLQYLASLRGGVPSIAISALAERLHLDLDQRCAAMSHGQRQKVGVIQALMHGPELLILDEPTATLDPLMQHTVHEILRERRARGITVFLSSHDLAEVSAICDRVGILRRGRLVAVEDVRDVGRKGRHTISIEFGEPVDAAVFERLPGVHSVATTNHTLTIGVTGDVDAVIKTAAKFTVRDVHSAELDLDEAFRHFYADEADDAR